MFMGAEAQQYLVPFTPIRPPSRAAESCSSERGTLLFSEECSGRLSAGSHSPQKLISDRLVDVGKFGKVQFDCYISMRLLRDSSNIEGRGILEKGKAVGKLADILHRLFRTIRKILSFIRGSRCPGLPCLNYECINIQVLHKEGTVGSETGGKRHPRHCRGRSWCPAGRRC